MTLSGFKSICMQVCMSHALSTETEEIMGLLLGDVVRNADEKLQTRIWSVSLHRYIKCDQHPASCPSREPLKPAPTASMWCYDDDRHPRSPLIALRMQFFHAEWFLLQVKKDSCEVPVLMYAYAHCLHVHAHKGTCVCMQYIHIYI